MYFEQFSIHLLSTYCVLGTRQGPGEGRTTMVTLLTRAAMRVHSERRLLHFIHSAHRCLTACWGGEGGGGKEGGEGGWREGEIHVMFN